MHTHSCLIFLIDSKIFAVPTTFVVMVSIGLEYETETRACAARWKMKSGFI